MKQKKFKLGKDDSVAWGLIEQMGWNKTADPKKIAKFWFDQLGKGDMEALSDFVSARVNELGQAVTKWELETGKSIEIGSDDGYSDVRYHIVGMGKGVFDDNIRNPELVGSRYRANQYQESFAYVFLEPEPPRTQADRQKTLKDLHESLEILENQFRQAVDRMDDARKTLSRLHGEISRVREDIKDFQNF